MPLAIQFAHVVGSQDSRKTVEGNTTTSVVWQIRVINLTGSGPSLQDLGVLCSPGELRALIALTDMPKEGYTWFRYTMADPTDLGSSYTRDLATEDVNLRVVDTQLAQSKDDPQIWMYTVTYAGLDDPTFELPEFESQSTEFLEYTNYDVSGRLVENSALDPFAGGMPRDRNQQSYMLTRNLPFESWYAGKASEFENTVNAVAFVLCRQVDGLGNPIIKAPGSVRIKKVTEKQMVRVKGLTPATSSYYWKVTAELSTDESTFPNTDTSTNGGLVKTHHRYVTPDRGFNQLIGGKKTPIRVSGGLAPTEEQFLNGAGQLLTSALDATPILPSLDWFNWGTTGKIFTRHDYYSVQAGGTLTVAAAGGVLANDELTSTSRTASVVTGVSPAVGTGGAFTFNADGSFTYTPNTGYSGWATFTYKVSAVGRTDSDPTTVVIRVGPQPVFLAFDRYRSKDWSPLSALLENW